MTLGFQVSLLATFLLLCLLVLSLQLVSEISCYSCQVPETVCTSSEPRPTKDEAESEAEVQSGSDSAGYHGECEMDDDIQSKKIFVDMSWKTLHNFMATSITKTSAEPPPKKKECMMSRNGLLKQPLESESWRSMFHGKSLLHLAEMIPMLAFARKI